MGTVLLSVLSGHQHYAHISALRGDGVNPALLGMSKGVAPRRRPEVSEDSVRRAFGKLDEEAGVAWLQEHLHRVYAPLLSEPWILDADVTVKPLYGHQEGAEVGYNPHKPGRPSHTYHTYLIAHLRLVLEVEGQTGKQTASKHSAPGLWALLQRVPREHWPVLIRGDRDWGTEANMQRAEQKGLPYVFKLRLTSGTRPLVERLMGGRTWVDAGQGWQGAESELRLAGWGRARRVVVLRRRVKGRLVAESKLDELQGQQTLVFADTPDGLPLWEYAVLVSNTEQALEAIGQLYRDRADCENGFDELKNQWGWGGYTTRDLERCNLSARAVALIYNWWSWYVRLAHPKARLEAITSRPLLLAGVARLTQHAGQSRLLLTLTHAAADQIKTPIANIRKGLGLILTTTPQLPKPERWRALVRYIVDQIIAAKPKNRSPLGLPPPLMKSETG